MSESLYERLGGTEGIKQIANDVVDNHAKNPQISRRFAESDLDKVKKTAAEFFIAGSGGPNVYEGMDMVAAHKAMNISNDEFVAVLDDAVAAMEKNNVGQREKEEVLYIFFSLKGEVVQQ
ncbi:MAG: hemoglobin [Alphaproteobacteria bacterium]|jgi:hemoglobin